MPESGSLKILVVDDEPSIVDAVATSLRYEGYDVTEAVTGRAALAAAQERTPDLIVLDVMLPDLDGLEVTRRLRADGIDVPVLFLTARDSLEDKLAGLNVGGDDYVTKPFALAEIIARVRVIMRRSYGEVEEDGILRFADIQLDERAHQVVRHGEIVELTATEFNLLRCFMLNPRQVLSKSQILDHVWHYDFGGEANVVETYVSYLRKKLERHGPPLIHTIRLVGYVLRGTADELSDRALSLRLRLVLAALTVAFIALVVADLVTYSALRSSLYQRIDQDLQASLMASGPGGGNSGQGSPNAPPGGSGPRAGEPDAQPLGGGGAFVATRSSSGRITIHSYATELGGKSYAPSLPADLTAQVSAIGVDKIKDFTTHCTVSGGPLFRVAVSATPDGDLRIVALPLDSTTATLRQLFYIEAGVTGAALLVALALGWWLVRVALRPLLQMESTAQAIAEGALEARVPGDDKRTEVGHLAATLNVMLARIQRAFNERDATEVELRTSEERLRRFVADASHELRTPLAAVSAYAELFARGADGRPADLERVMRGIRGESARMSRLVEDLLLLARLDEGRPFEHEPVELVELVAESAQAAAMVGPGWPVRLDASSTVEVLGDRERLRQVVDNLLANVRAHTPDGTSTVVRIRASGDQAAIEVSDDGPGLTPEQATRVFDRFYRADTSRSRGTGGTGLGLSIVAAIVEAHGGTVGASAGGSGGATFTVRLPLAGVRGVSEAEQITT